MGETAWIDLGGKIIGPLLADTKKLLNSFKGDDFHVTQVPILALYHLAHCFDAGMDANEKGRHSIAISLLRQAVESITLIELGLLEPSFSYSKLEKWDQGKITHGELRQQLEKYV